MSWTWDETLFAGTARHYTLGRLPYPDGLADAIAGALGLDGTGTLLDVGCGPGTLALRLADRFADVLGVDPDEGMLDEAERLRIERGIPNVRWLRCRAEELADADPDAHADVGLHGPVRAATFGASFHWIDRDLVAATIHDLLEPDGGAFVHVGPGHPDPARRRDELPRQAIDDLIARYLGTTKRAGRGVRLTSPGDEEAVLARLPFDGPQRVVVPQPDGGVVRTADQAFHHVLSMSYAAPHLFGDRLPDFERELRALLAARPSYRFDHGDTLVRIWRRRPGNNRSHG